MIKVNETYITADVDNIVDKLKTTLAQNGIQRFYKSVDTPNNYMVCCPFHKEGQERKPSMGILKSDGTCHCFACGWAGSLQEMISNCFGYDDFGVYGGKWLIKNFLTLEVEDREEIELDVSRNRSRSSVDTTNYVSEEELDSYRWNHPYWAKRGITDEGLIELFDLGYDSKTDCITFPIRDVNGRCLFVARRSTKTKYFNYPAGAEKPVYGLYELERIHAWDKYRMVSLNDAGKGVNVTELIVCESMLDALTCWQYGKYAVALNGLGNDLQFKQLRSLPCRKLILATDNDAAGMRARQRISKNVTNKIITQYMLPDGKKDINELSELEFLSINEIFL